MDTITISILQIQNSALRSEVIHLTNEHSFAWFKGLGVLIITTQFLIASQSHNEEGCPGHIFSPFLSGKIFHPSRPSKMTFLWLPSTVHNFPASPKLPQKLFTLYKCSTYLTALQLSRWGPLVFPARCQKFESWNLILLIVDTPKLGAGALLKETWPRYHSQGLKLVWFGLESRHQHFGNFCSISNVFIIIFVTVPLWSMICDITTVIALGTTVFALGHHEPYPHKSSNPNVSVLAASFIVCSSFSLSGSPILETQQYWN